MDLKIARLKEEIQTLNEEKEEREAALPAHSIRPHQLLAIEELEEAIGLKQKELERLIGIQER
jgi:uncharacterized small protein (DUF1192 family)